MLKNYFKKSILPFVSRLYFSSIKDMVELEVNNGLPFAKEEKTHIIAFQGSKIKVDITPSLPQLEKDQVSSTIDIEDEKESFYLFHNPKQENKRTGKGSRESNSFYLHRDLK